MISTASSDDFSFDPIVMILTNETEACTSVSLTEDSAVEGIQTFSLSVTDASSPAVFDSSERVGDSDH